LEVGHPRPEAGCGTPKSTRHSACCIFSVVAPAVADPQNDGRTPGWVLPVPLS